MLNLYNILSHNKQITLDKLASSYDLFSQGLWNKPFFVRSVQHITMGGLAHHTKASNQHISIHAYIYILTQIRMYVCTVYIFLQAHRIVLSYKLKLFYCSRETLQHLGNI